MLMGAEAVSFSSVGRRCEREVLYMVDLTVMTCNCCY